MMLAVNMILNVKNTNAMGQQNNTQKIRKGVPSGEPLHKHRVQPIDSRLELRDGIRIH